MVYIEEDEIKWKHIQYCGHSKVLIGEVNGEQLFAIFFTRQWEFRLCLFKHSKLIENKSSWTRETEEDCQGLARSVLGHIVDNGGITLEGSNQ